MSAIKHHNRLRFIKEPIVHFIFIGSLIFIGFYYFNKSSNNKKMIEISAAQIELMKNSWERQLGRPPSDHELRGLIDDHIKEEVLMREALAIGLDKNDVIIRRRLAQKMEFVSNDILIVKDPTLEEIKEYYTKNKELLIQEPLLSFLQVYIKVDGRDLFMAAKKADKLRNELVKMHIENIDLNSIGDRTMLRSDFKELSLSWIVTEFGDTEFSRVVPELQINKWSEPLQSSYGLHLVYPYDYVPEYMPPLEEVQDEIKRKLINQRKQELDKKFLDGLIEKYTIQLNQ